MHISCSKKLQLLAEFSAVSDSRNFITARKICEFIIEIISDSLWLMRNAKQETRAEKICRYIGNLNRGLAQYPELRSLRERKAEREAQLRAMPLEVRLELVPPEETERERKELIVTYTEIIADVEKERECSKRFARLKPRSLNSAESVQSLSVSPRPPSINESCWFCCGERRSHSAKPLAVLMRHLVLLPYL